MAFYDSSVEGAQHTAMTLSRLQWSPACPERTQTLPLNGRGTRDLQPHLKLLHYGPIPSLHLPSLLWKLPSAKVGLKSQARKPSC